MKSFPQLKYVRINSLPKMQTTLSLRINLCWLPSSLLCHFVSSRLQFALCIFCNFQHYLTYNNAFNLCIQTLLAQVMDKQNAFNVYAAANLNCKYIILIYHINCINLSMHLNIIKLSMYILTTTNLWLFKFGIYKNFLSIMNVKLI